ncbi:ATP phosphoribosyltransferase [Ahniella affigens]|uniref:ATP phosphoribosyltransferase n=1 Tax=Ahniella affigens TaxID=2021234 RepID=A0A2P1PQ01_9GAMM|nr:ATP phosphoribosyltransferase [Ahniella affigens]AVP96915.1 ATP phosphoribosyltransferase [Ahniella affigens]
MKTRDRLRIAVQKSGRLADASQQLLAQCGFRFRQSRDKLFCFGETHAVDLLLVRDDDIPGLIAEGTCDLGFVGRNVLAEQRLAQVAEAGSSALCEVRALGFGGCRLAIAVPQEEPWVGPEQLQGRKIATSYPALLANYLRENRVQADIVVLSGSVEIAPKLGKAEVICDLVSSGATLAANQLKETAVILKSEAVLAAADLDFVDERAPVLDLLLRRLDGVMAVRETKLLLMQLARADLSEVKLALPKDAMASVLSSDEDRDELCLQAVVRSALDWAELERLKGAGARNLMVLPVERMLA